MKRRLYTIYCNEQPLASTEACDCIQAIANLLGPAKVWKIEGTNRRYVSRDDRSVEYTVIRLPTDDDDCAAWIVDKDRDVRFVSSEELALLPEFVTDTINIGCLAVEDKLMISPSLGQLFEEQESA